MLEYTLIRKIAGIIKNNHNRRSWKKKNKHNSTCLNACKDSGLITVGNNSYGELNVVSFKKDHKLIIGNYVSIAQHVTFILDAEHYTNHLSTFPFQSHFLGIEESFAIGNIIIEDDVWIGYGATILSGVHIGQGAVIAAGAVVSRDVEPYSIVGGVPAKLIKYRFSASSIKYLRTLDFSKLNEKIIKAHLNVLYEEIDFMTSEELEKKYKWFPKK